MERLKAQKGGARLSKKDKDLVVAALHPVATLPPVKQERLQLPAWPSNEPKLINILSEEEEPTEAPAASRAGAPRAAAAAQGRAVAPRSKQTVRGGAQGSRKMGKKNNARWIAEVKKYQKDGALSSCLRQIPPHASPVVSVFFLREGARMSCDVL